MHERTAELEIANRELESANKELEAFSYSCRMIRGAAAAYRRILAKSQDLIRCARLLGKSLDRSGAPFAGVRRIDELLIFRFRVANLCCLETRQIPANSGGMEN